MRHLTLEKFAMRVFNQEAGDMLGSILQCLHFPLLRDFQWEHSKSCCHWKVRIDELPPEWPQAAFLDFFCPLGCTLSELWIDNSPAEEDILRYLREVLSLIDLALSLSRLSTQASAGAQSLRARVERSGTPSGASMPRT